DPASRKRRRALSCIVVAQQFRRQYGAAESLLAMKFFGSLGAILNAWTASVAGAVIAGLNRIVSPRVVRLIEGGDGGFAVEAAGKGDNVPSTIAFAAGAAPAGLAAVVRGSRVEIVLQPKRFLFR